MKHLADPADSPRFLGIRGQVILFAGFTLVLTALTFTALQLRQFEHIQEQSWKSQRDKARDLAGRLFVHQSLRLQSLASVVSDLPGLRAALRTHDGRQVERSFAPFWSDLSLTHSLDRVVFYSREGRLLGEWGLIPADAVAQSLAIEAGRREIPASQLDCRTLCRFVIAVPLVDRGHTVGAVVLAVGLQDLIMDFRGLSGMEVAMLKHVDAADEAGAAVLGARIVSISGGGRYEELVHTLGTVSNLNEGHVLERDGRQYGVFQFNAPVTGGERVHFLVMHDHTANMLAMRDSIWKNLAASAFILLFALLTLFVVLQPTMNRIKQAARALPLLGEGLFAEARGAFYGRRARLFSDEIDIFEHLTSALASTLERLGVKARHQSQALHAQARQLEYERDFIAGLFDTAPVLILTYDVRGRIQMANAHAIRACGRASVVGASYFDIFLSPAMRALHGKNLGRLQVGQPMQNEDRLERFDGEAHEIVWFHSRLDERDGEPTFLSVGLDVSERKRAEQRLSLLVDHDVVTGLYNRRAFKRELATHLSGGEQGMLLLCGMDHRDMQDEAGGESALDALRFQFAGMLRNLRPGPTLAAYLDDDVFACTFSGLTEADAILLARNLNLSLANLRQGQEEQQRLSVCVGVVAYPAAGADVDTLLGSATRALLRARAKGRGAWHLGSEDDSGLGAAGHRAYWQDIIERALADNGFVLLFQPVRHIASDRIAYYEALLRLTLPDGSQAAPGKFLAVAETSDLIRRIDHWVIEAVAKFAAAQPAEIKVAFNLSGTGFMHDETLAILKRQLDVYGLSGERLLIEVAEKVVLDHFAAAGPVIQRFRSLGTAFCLDDFGSGYSAFQYLKDLPVDMVKIDGSFTRGLVEKPDDVVFVRALATAVRGFGKTTVAEFVEDEATLNLLTEIGVDYVQGHFIGRPAVM